MKLKEFLNNIQKMVEEDPSLLELDVITSKDDEGNGFEEVYYSPSVGVFEDSEFVPSDSEDFEEEYEYTKKDINAICIN
jgi:hypothetical protein